jgi:prophage antirepressor-like protein
VTEGTDTLPVVQFFYREGKQLRALEFQGEVWFSLQDVLRGMGYSTLDEQRVALLLGLTGIMCMYIPCTDGARRLSLFCISEDGLMGMFAKMEAIQ